MTNFLDRLARGPLLADGAMGTLLYSRGIGFDRCFDALCESDPALVRAVHADYVAAGAELIETNTFGANRHRLAEHGLADRVREINLAGARLARAAADRAGRPVWVAGSVGPLGVAVAPAGGAEEAAAAAAFAEQVRALADGGVDVIVVETMRSTDEARLAVAAARTACGLPVIALATFGEDGVTGDGHAPDAVARLLQSAGADVVGANCSTGPAQMLDVVLRMAPAARVPIAAIPNAGLPTMVGGRYSYTSSPAYMAEMIAQMVAAGARIVGGCCGTTPEHIAAMAATLATGAGQPRDARAAPRLSFPAREVETEGSPEPPGPTAFQRALGRRFTVAVTVDPPRGFEAAAVPAGVRALVDAGRVDVVDVADSPQARAHVSALAMSVVVQDRLGIEAVLNLGCRYRNAVALHAELMGAHALGVRNVVGIMGELPAHGDYPDATVVNDISDVRLVALMAACNRGSGGRDGQAAVPAAFHIGCQLDLGAVDLMRELHQFQAKVDAGAQFAFTDPVFDLRLVDAALAHLGGRFPIPVLAGVLPLWNARHAAYLHNEVPGMEIPAAVLRRMAAAGDDGRAIGVAIAVETIAALGDAVAGVRLMAPFGKHGVVAAVLDALAVSGPAAADRHLHPEAPPHVNAVGPAPASAEARGSP